MAIKDLVPRMRGERKPERRGEEGLVSFQHEMNRLFDDFFHSVSPFGAGETSLLPAWDRGAFAPAVNVSETEKEVRVSAELPGMDEKDVTVELDENAVTIKGAKKEEREEKGRNWHRIEHAYGSFHRVIPLPTEVKTDKAKATFMKGVLNVTLPKKEEAKGKRKTIEITTE
jgi:HSP20 family protein